MQRADCMTCINRIDRPFPRNRSFMGSCVFDMRNSSTAGGSEPNDLLDVYWCGDYDPGEEEDWQV